MKGLLVLLATVAVASCSPTLGLLSGAQGGKGQGAGGVGHAVNLPGALVGGATGGLPGAIIGGAIRNPVSIPGALVGGALAGGPGAIVGGLLGGAAGGGGAGGLPGPVAGGSSGLGGLHGAGGGLSGALGGLVGGILGGARPGGGTDRGYKQKGGVYPVGGGGLFQALGFLAQGLTDIVGNAGSILDDVVHLRIPAVLDDGFNAVISTGRGLGGIINALIPGLGSLLGNLVVAIGKLAICLLGSPGLTGSLLGRTPGKDNPRDIPYICTPDYGRNWGCSYNGPYDNADSIISYYKLKNAKKQALKFINQYTEGRGVGSLTGSRRIVVEHILILADILDKGSNNWNNDDIVKIAINIIIINGALGDSYQRGLGAQIVDDWITTLKKNNKNKRFPDLTKYRAQIFAALKGTTEDKWAGAFRRNSQDDSSSNESDSNNNDYSSNNDSDSQSDSNSNDSSSNNNENNGSSGNDSNSNSDGNSGSEESNDDNGSNNADNGTSGSNDQDSNGNDSSNSDNNNNDGSTYLHKKDASSKYNRNSDENSLSKTSASSGKSQINSDGSHSSEYNLNNAENSNNKKTSESKDDSSSELDYRHDDDF